MIYIKPTKDCDMRTLESEDSKHWIDVDGLNETLGSFYADTWWSFKDIPKGYCNYDNIILNKDPTSFVSGKLPDVKLPPKAEVKKKLIELRKKSVWNYFVDYEWDKKQTKEKEAFAEANKDKLTKQCQSFYKKIEDETKI